MGRALTSLESPEARHTLCKKWKEKFAYRRLHHTLGLVSGKWLGKTLRMRGFFLIQDPRRNQTCGGNLDIQFDAVPLVIRELASILFPLPLGREAVVAMRGSLFTGRLWHYVT